MSHCSICLTNEASKNTFLLAVPGWEKEKPLEEMSIGIKRNIKGLKN